MLDIERPTERLNKLVIGFIQKLKESHEMIFSWLSWLAVMLVGACARRRRQQRRGGVAQDGGHPPNNRLTETCRLQGLSCTSLILDIHVMIN